jgi:putative sterol carrier protein
MASKDEVRSAILKMVKVLEDPEVAADFKGYRKTMQFIFPDIDVKMQLVFDEAKTSIVEGFKENADMSLTVDAETLIGITNGDVDPMDAFMQGKLKPAGDMQALEKLEALMVAAE